MDHVQTILAEELGEVVSLFAGHRAEAAPAVIGHRLVTRAILDGDAEEVIG